MIAKSVALIFCTLAVLCNGAPQAARYPAGVDPHACPNYPDCDNVALAASVAQQAQVPQAAPYSAPYAAQSYSSYAPPSSGVPRAADAYPAGVDSRVCPNYPYCGPTPAHVPAAPQQYRAPPPANNWAAPAPQNNWAAPAAAPNSNWAVQTLSNWPGSQRAQSNWAAPAPQNNWAAPAPQNNWAAAAPQSNWAAPAAAPAQPAAAQYPAGVDPHVCPNYPYCY
ncbi:vitelline membrane-like protein [Hetaerina americana]|uniref:vitelline membrane-like protein n=1 Tax=Hetaerina americana TaxID=62018 RepID=UPI003A7F62A5